MAHTDDRTRSVLAARTKDRATPPTARTKDRAAPLAQAPPVRRQRTGLLLFLAAGLTLLTVGLLRGQGVLIAAGLIMAGLVECLLGRHRDHHHDRPAPHRRH
ncbi:hypothetical protein ABGB17_34105 [Sphaerisporangium sp. B11E5]|uniref:hypothetical protein n=1 Tax=Sphaerisporangium sp. B11E5 TaxID=3153563 RepID=UPI00325C42CD